MHRGPPRTCSAAATPPYAERRSGLDEYLCSRMQSRIMGEAGSGKSSLLRFVALDILSDHPVLKSTKGRTKSTIPVWLRFAFGKASALIAAPFLIEDAVAEFFRTQRRTWPCRGHAARGPGEKHHLAGCPPLQPPTRRRRQHSGLGRFRCARKSLDYRQRGLLLASPNAYNSLGVGTTQLYDKTVVYNHKRHGEFHAGRPEVCLPYEAVLSREL